VARAHVWHHVPETRRPRHFHSEPELNLIAAGTATFGVGDMNVVVAAGDLLWWPPGQDHVLLEASPDFDLFVIGLTPALSARVLGSNGAAAYSGATSVRLDPPALARLRSLCAAPLAADSTAVETHLGELWGGAHQLRLAAPGKHALTRSALVSLMQAPERPRSEIASKLGGHPTDLSRHFHKDVGLQLNEYRTRLRLLRFIEAASAGRTNLLLAALDAGFGSYSQCHRVFHETLGCSPRRYFRAEVRTKMEGAFWPFGRGS
jgi:AraC-like DNA-binding protein